MAAAEVISGISLKFWRMTSLQDEEDNYSTQETCTFIIPEYTDTTLDTLKKLILAVSKVEELFPDLEKRVLELESLDVKEEINFKRELEEYESKAVKGEDRVKDEPCYFEEDYNIIDDTIEYDPPKKRKRKKTTTKLKEKKEKSVKSNYQGPKKSCLKCDKKFVWIRKFLNHLKRCNPGQLKDEPGEEEIAKGQFCNNGSFTCEKCSMTFQKSFAYENHMRAHQLSAELKESKETKLPNNNGLEPALQLDIKSEKAATPLASTNDGLSLLKLQPIDNRCEACDLAYPNYQMYKTHMDQFHKKSLPCPDCEQRFTYEKTLLKHKLDYHTQYPKQCNQCTDVFLTAKSLYEHIDVHAKHLYPKTSPCEICGKLLKDKYTLKAHVEAVHEKRAGGDYACEQCGKMLKSKSSLSYHKKSAHTQDYPHRCDICGKGYIKYNRMVNCLNNHQGIFKYRCPECDYKSNKLIQFKEHVNMHTGEKSFYCPVCKHKSSGTKNLGCHIKQVHKMTLCQAEVAYRTNRFGEPMTDDQIEDMKVRMSSLSNYNEKIVQELKSTTETSEVHNNSTEDA